MITYNEIYEAARKERYSEQLQVLPKNFLEEVANYLSEKRKVASKNDDLFSGLDMKSKKQIENAQTLFRELILRRRRKILDLVLISTETSSSTQDVKNMLDSEKDLFNEIIGSIKNTDEKITQELKGISKKNNLQKIRFREDVEEFVGLEGESIGPFKKEQITEMPKEISKILIDSNKAEIVE